jgi:hypothetical protein
MILIRAFAQAQLSVGAAVAKAVHEQVGVQRERERERGVPGQADRFYFGLA